MKGKFIVLEGLDGSGKGTQYDKIFDYLCQWCLDTGQHALGDCEPTNGLIGKTIREYLKKDKVDNQTLQYLFMADRTEHTKAIKETLDKGTNVLLDRYWYSTYAYQGVDMEYPYSIIEMNEDFLVPDIVFYIDTPVDVCLERINKRDKSKEVYEKKEYLEKVHEMYEKLWDTFYHPMHKFPIRINGNQPEEKVFEDIKKVLEEKLK